MAEKTKAEEVRLNLRPDILLDFVKDAQVQRRSVASAQGRYRAVLKKAKEAGINTKLMLAAMAKLDQDSEDRKAEEAELHRYMGWMGMSVGAQSSMELDKPAQKALDQFTIAQHEETGYRAGRGGRNRDDHGLTAGTPAHAAWDKGWSMGQADIAAEMAPGETKRTGRKGRGGNAEDGPAPSLVN